MVRATEKQVDRDYIGIIYLLGEFLPMSDPYFQNLVHQAVDSCQDYESLLVVLQLIAWPVGDPPNG